MTVDYSVSGNMALITLNKPKVLNALSFDMIKEITAILKSVKKDQSISLVLLKAKGEKAFCSGGDVVKFYEEKFTNRFKLRKEFFYKEYKLNYMIKKFPKPIISFVNGICMGGGVGLSAHGAIMVISERVKFAMPETAIGLFPDVGAGNLLSSLPGELGAYLALTGKRLNSADLLSLGIAKYCVPYNKFNYLEEDLIRATNIQIIESKIKSFVIKPESKMFPVLNDEISNCFKFENVEDIISELEKSESDWAEEALNLMGKMSPTSLKITLRQIRLARNMSFEEDLIMEYRLSQGCMRGHDFYEGVRSVLVDKDHTPRWKPKLLKRVTKQMVDSHFISLGKDDLKLGLRRR